MSVGAAPSHHTVPTLTELSGFLHNKHGNTIRGKGSFGEVIQGQAGGELDDGLEVMITPSITSGIENNIPPIANVMRSKSSKIPVEDSLIKMSTHRPSPAPAVEVEKNSPIFDDRKHPYNLSHGWERTRTVDKVLHRNLPNNNLNTGDSSNEIKEDREHPDIPQRQGEQYIDQDGYVLTRKEGNTE
ncbi:hypothetical protein M422DRAFT_257515 [Sphaerobolus stellatus SS14]|uniref:Uncharacterized protein n=1 Tax=Sphaerobolus stellatus (strain SS14) TaxID=990650 RepID=A0A0C9VE54_SPHS4|nr:hypothetical protein M422DRAFT_257515 [Sphaerobolus stellatus SS14]